MKERFFWGCISVLILCAMVLVSVINVKDDITLAWEDDIDKDGLLHFEEEILKTSKDVHDSDGDGLTDLFELEIGTSPTNSDTNNDGILDSNDDFDNDGLSNLEEQKLNTNALFYDSDNDDLSDYEEVKVYKTDANNKDSDNDKILDYDEILIGINPSDEDSNNNGIKDGEEVYKFSESKSFSDDSNLEINLSGEIKGKYINDLIIADIKTSHSFINKHMAGYIVPPFKIGIKNIEENLELDLKIIVEQHLLGEDGSIAIYQYDEKTNHIKELTNSVITKNEISLKIDLGNEFKEFVVLRADIWDKAWEKEIVGFNFDTFETDESIFNIDSDNDGIPDYFEENLRLIDGSLPILDKNNPDTDGDGLSDGFEISGKDNNINAFFESYNFEKEAFGFISRPDLKDTDGDSILDGNGKKLTKGSFANIVDKEPRIENINDKMLLLSADLSYYKEEIESGVLVKDLDYLFDDDTTQAVNCEISDWEVVEFNNGGSLLGFDGFGAIGLKKGDMLIVSYTGSTDITDWAGNAITLVSKHPQTDNAIKFMTHMLEEFEGEINRIYISGHSLGGYLTQQTANSLKLQEKDFTAVTFNSQNFASPEHIEKEAKPVLTDSSLNSIEELGFLEGVIKSILKIPPLIDRNDEVFIGFSNLNNIEDDITNYVIENDPLYLRIGGAYLGEEIVLDKGKFIGDLNIIRAHKLKNFYDEDLESILR